MPKVQFFLNGQQYHTQYDITLLQLIHYFNYNLYLLVLEYNNLICNRKDFNNIFIKENECKNRKQINLKYRFNIIPRVLIGEIASNLNQKDYSSDY